MGTISTTALLGRLVDLDVLHDQVAGIEALGIGVRFCVFEQAEEEFGGFLGPAGAGNAELFACTQLKPLAPSILHSAPIRVWQGSHSMGSSFSKIVETPPYSKHATKFFSPLVLQHRSR